MFCHACLAFDILAYLVRILHSILILICLFSLSLLPYIVSPPSLQPVPPVPPVPPLPPLPAPHLSRQL